MPTKLAGIIVHRQPLRESADVRVERLDDGRIRLGLWRRSPASRDPDDFVLASGFAVDLEGARELRNGLTMALHHSPAPAGRPVDMLEDL